MTRAASALGRLYIAAVEPFGGFEKSMRSRRVLTVFGVAVSIFFGLQLFRGLSAQDLANDEAIYSYSIAGIIERGEWLMPPAIPHAHRPGDPGDNRYAGGVYHNRPFLEKPPLKFWIVASPIILGLLPLDEFGLRFWDAFFGAIVFVYVFLIGRRLVDYVCGIAAVSLLFIQPALMFGHGIRSNVMEAAVMLAYAGGIYHFLAWSDSERLSRRWLHILAFTGWFVLGFMTKFVAALFLPAIVGLTALCFVDWRRRLRVDLWRWSVGALIALVIVLPWFLYAHFVFGDRFWDIIFGQHVYDRMRGVLHDSHIRTWDYYFQEISRQLSGIEVLDWVRIGGGDLAY